MKRISRKHNCFVFMPISDTKGYERGHFSRVYEEIIKVVIINLGYQPIRTDDLVRSYADIIPKIIHSLVGICDLSTENTNVLFELGFRLLHNKPTVIIQEHGSPQIYDPIFNRVLQDIRFKVNIND